MKSEWLLRRNQLKRLISYGSLSVLFVLFAWAASVARSGQQTTNRTGFTCTENVCKPNGCAICAHFAVEVPQGVQNAKAHCWTTADAPGGNGPDSDIHEIPCGADWAWSYFS